MKSAPSGQEADVVKRVIAIPCGGMESGAIDEKEKNFGLADFRHVQSRQQTFGRHGDFTTGNLTKAAEAVALFPISFPMPLDRH